MSAGQPKAPAIKAKGPPLSRRPPPNHARLVVVVDVARVKLRDTDESDVFISEPITVVVDEQVRVAPDADAYELDGREDAVSH